jgi:hypothetical protein
MEADAPQSLCPKPPATPRRVQVYLMIQERK